MTGLLRKVSGVLCCDLVEPRSYDALPSGLDCQTAALLPDGRILAAGGIPMAQGAWNRARLDLESTGGYDNVDLPTLLALF